MTPGKSASVAAPRYVDLPSGLSVIGLSRHYPFDRVGELPDQWQSFAASIPGVTRDEQPVTYGVIYNGNDASFDYLSGVELPDTRECPENLVRLLLAPQRYAVFQHAGHVAALRDTCDAIWADWLPASQVTVVEAPWFERYGESFDPQTGEGGVEVWIPVSR